MDTIRRTLLEKLARDVGFDRLAREHKGWLVVGSSHFAEDVLLRTNDDGATVAATLKRARSRELSSVAGIAADGSVDADGGLAEPREVWRSESDDALAAMLSVVASEARLRRYNSIERFAARTRTLPKSTEAERLVIARVGQDIFRDALIEYWGGRCAVTGLQVISLLRASHAKPWSDCDTDAERLDVFNGFLLAPSWDAAFDGGWISFDDTGRVLVSSEIEPKTLSLLGIDIALRLTRVDPKHLPYLAFHRLRVFRGQANG
jgi:hypothetical protein